MGPEAGLNEVMDGTWAARLYDSIRIRAENTVFIVVPFLISSFLNDG